MPIILLSIKNPKESVSIKQFLLKNNIQVVTCLLTYASFVKALHYEPDMILSEFSENKSSDFFELLKCKNENPKIKKVPHICYGNECPAEMIETLRALGVPVYIKRPLKKAHILAILSKIINSQNTNPAPSESIQSAIPKEDDLGKLKDRSISINKKFSIMRNHIVKLLAFPMTIANILRVTQNEKSGAGDLATIIRTDPAVSAEILRAVNSVHYSRGTSSISNIKDAIVRIGFMESRKLALSISVFKLSKQKNFSSGFDHIEFWFHSLAVAVIAERIARNSMLINPEEAFIGGLLHDIGLLLLNEYFNPLFLELLSLSIDNNISFLKCEATTIGITHNLLMKDLFTEWNFPQTIIQSVPFFSRPDCITKQHLEKFPLAVIITVSELIARSMNIGKDTDCSIIPIPSQILEMLKLPYGIQKAFTETIYTTINKFNYVLKIDSREFPFTEETNSAQQPMILYCCLSVEVYNPVYEYCVNNQYSIKKARTINELKENAADCNILIIENASAEHKELIKSLESLIPATGSSESESADQNDTSPSPMPLKIILLSKEKPFNDNDFNPENVISLSYPLDVRNIDGIISCFINGYSPQDFLFKKAEPSHSNEETVDNTSKSKNVKNILLVHSKNNYRIKFNSVIEKIAGLHLTEFDQSKDENDIHSIASQPFKTIFLEFSSTEHIIEIVNTFKNKASSKPQFVIIFNTVKKEDLLPLINKGITLFLSENDTNETIEKRVFATIAS